MPQQSLDPTYRQALAHSWSLLFKHKSLWLLGLIAVILGQFGAANFIGRLWTFLTTPSLVQELWWLPLSWGTTSPDSLVATLGTSWLMLIFLALAFTVVVAGVVAEGSLVAVALAYFRSKTLLPLSKAWFKGVERFWSLLGVMLIEKTICCLMLYLTVGIWYVMPFTAAGYAGRFAAVMIAVLVAMLFAVGRVFAVGFIVDRGLKVLPAYIEGLALVLANPLVALELSVIFVAATLLLVAVLTFGAYLVVIPASLLMLMGGFGDQPFVAMLGFVLAAVLFIMLVAITSGLFNAFIVNGWMYCYLHLRRRGIKSRVRHALEHFSF